MDVTTELLKQNQTYSASDNTNPDRYSSSRSLNYATGASISKAELAEVNVVPFSLQYSLTANEGSSSCTDCPENYYGSTNGQISYCSKCSSDRPSTCGKTGSTSFSSCSLPKDSCIQCGYNTEYENHKCCGAYSNQVKSWKKVNGCSQCRTELLCK